MMPAAKTPSNGNTGDTSLKSRIERLEAHFIHLSETLDRLSVNFGQGMRDLENKLDGITDRGRITWPLIFAAVATMISFSGVAYVFHEQSMIPVRENISRNQRILEEHSKSSGHVDALVRVAEVGVVQAELQRDLEKLEDLIASRAMADR